MIGKSSVRELFSQPSGPIFWVERRTEQLMRLIKYSKLCKTPDSLMIKMNVIK